MGADPTEPNNDDEGGAEAGETGISKEDTIACELLKDQLVIVFASPSSGSNECAMGVLLAAQGGRSGCAVFSELNGVISPKSLGKETQLRELGSYVHSPHGVYRSATGSKLSGLLSQFFV